MYIWWYFLLDTQDIVGISSQSKFNPLRTTHVCRTEVRPDHHTEHVLFRVQLPRKRLTNNWPRITIIQTITDRCNKNPHPA